MKPYWKWLVSLSLLVFLSLPVRALNPDYNFSIVAINGQTIDGLTLTAAFGATPPCINDFGEVVFTGSYSPSPGNYETAIFTPYHVIVKTGDEVDGEVLTGVFYCALNDFGALVYGGRLESGKAALFVKPGPLPAERIAVVGESIGGLELQNFYNVAINNFGEVVFSAAYHGPNNSIATAIFTPRAVLVAPGSEVDHYVLSGIDPMFAMSSRDVFFHGSNPSIGEGMFTLHRLLVKIGDVVSGFQFEPTGGAAFGFPAASERGGLIFGGVYATGAGIFTPRSILVATGGLLPPVASVNNSGTIVYGGANGLIVNQTPLVDFGDTIDGHTLNGLSFPLSINNRGAVAFKANFTSGYEGIVLATPKARIP